MIEAPWYPIVCVLALKGNQGNFHKEMVGYVNQQLVTDFVGNGVRCHETREKEYDPCDRLGLEQSTSNRIECLIEQSSVCQAVITTIRL